MGIKGEQTKEEIKRAAYMLFAEKGFKAVTMKDICERTGLSRGGLYRHYDSTRVIFEEIFMRMADVSYKNFEEKITSKIPAVEILEELLEDMRTEMLDANNSLSLAIYEYANEVSKDFFESLNEKGRKRWQDLLAYGMATGAFKKVDSDQVIDMIIYAYQGVRMWSRVLFMDEKTADHIINGIREMVIL